MNRSDTMRLVLHGGLAALLLAADASFANDPRPPADAPFAADAEPQQRLSRRARRAARRRTAASDHGADADMQSGRGRPPAIPHEAIVHRNRPYGESSLPCQCFDIHLPEGCSGEVPLLVWIQGTSWQSGPQEDCPVAWLVQRGYAVASVGYRLATEATFPAQIDDCLAALDTLERDAELWGIDRDRVCVAGIGAGGHLAALAGLWNRSATERPLPRVAAVAAFAAPTHLTTLGPRHDRATSPASLLVGGPLPEFREAAQQASPLTHVAAGGPPVLLVHGRRDAVVPPDQSIRFDAALKAAGIDSRLVLLSGADHDLPLDAASPAGVALVDFLDRTLGTAGREP